MEDGQHGDVLDMTTGKRWSDAVALPADPASATDARHFIRSALTTADVDGRIIDSVELVVSELVTNAVLHAAAGPTLSISLDDGIIRIEVRDDSPAAPTMVDFGENAVTGRGLSVVGSSAMHWGFDTHQTGKTVWAEFSTNPNNQSPETVSPEIHSEIIVDNTLGEDAQAVQFNAIPVRLYLQLEESNDATLREFELLAIQMDNDASQVKSIHHRLAELIVRSNAYFNGNKNRMRLSIMRANERGLKTVDMRLHIDADGVTFAKDFSTLMIEADALSDRGVLLTSPPSDAVRRLRKWFVDEMVAQYAEGRPPSPFPVQG